MRLSRAFAVLLVTALAIALAQENTIKVDVDLVNILFSARQKNGGLVSNLEKDDVQVYEDGKLQTLRTFNREADLPLTIGLLVDVSRSQEALIGIEQSAASQFFSKVLRPKDIAFLISFGAEAELLQDYTGSATLLKEALRQLRVNGPAYSPIHPGPVPSAGGPRGTILFDAVYLAANDKLKGEVGRKAVVLITDGVDQGSRLKLSQAVEAAQRADVIIYSIYYMDPRAYGGFGASDGDLRRMSDETGGRLFKVDRRHTLDEVFGELQDELRSQYAVSYSSTNTSRDGGYRKLEIKARGGKDLKVQARKGYYASKP